MIIPILILTLFVLIFVLFKYEKYEVKYVVSDIDGEKYLVRDLPDKQKSANTLAKIKANIFTLTRHLDRYKSTKYKDYESYISQLSRRIKGVIINESTEDSVYTSYSVNKGEQIVFCLRSKRHKNEFHNLNLIMYVVLHELAHVGCPEYGHTPLFKKIFAFFTTVAIDIGLYNKIDFQNNPTEYCGLEINDSIV